MKPFRYPPDIWGAVILLIGLTLFEIFIANIFYAAGITVDADDPRSSAIDILAYGILFSLYIYVSGLRHADLLHPSPEPVTKTLRLSALPVALVVLGMAGWLWDIELFISEQFDADEEALTWLSGEMDDGYATFIIVCIAVPFLEEILFRGIILRGFLAHYSPLNAVLASAAVFGIIHWNIYQVPGAFVFGCFAGWLFYLTRSLWPCIFAHAMTNTLSFVFFLLYPESYLADYQPEYNSLAVNGLTFVLTLLGLYVLYRIFTQPNARTTL